MADRRKHRTVELDGDKIEALMNVRGWSSEELARRAVISTANVSLLLRNDHPVLWSTARKLMKAFEIESVEEIRPDPTTATAKPSAKQIQEWLFDEPQSKWITASNQLQFRIWRLRHEHLSKHARGKCYDLQGMSSAERERCKALLLRHAEVCSRLGRHPHIITNLTTCEVESSDQWWVIDEWIEGKTLGDRLQAGACEIESVKIWGRQLAEALRAMHNRGILRRELSPQTVLIEEQSGDAVLTEFELAKLLDGSPTVSQDDWPVDPYRAPEAISDKVGTRADIYSWARIVVHMLLGELPEKGKEKSRIAKAELSDEMKSMLTKCVSASWRSRPSDINKVLSALQAWK